MDDHITTVEITLARILTSDGQLAVRIVIPETYNAVEVLGLLEMAKIHIYNELNGLT